MKITDNSLSIIDIQNGDIIVEDGRYFMVVEVVTSGGQHKYGYMSIETGVVMSAKYDSPIKMYDDCFSPTTYDTQIRRIEEIVITNL